MNPDFDAIKQLISQWIPVDEADFARFASLCRVQSLAKKTIWQAEGEIGRYLAFVGQGIIRQYYTKSGEEKTDQFYAEGEFVGNYVSYLQQQPSRMAIQALSDCELLVIAFADLQQLYEEVPAVERFARIIAEQKLIELHERTAGFLLDSAEERYAKLLQQKPNIHARVPLYLIAQYLGIKAESLSRIRRRMSDLS